MKIVFTTDSLARGGKERQLSLLFSSISKHLNAAIWVRNVTLENNFLKEYNIESSQVNLYAGFKSFYSLLKKQKPQVIYTWDIKSTLYALVLIPFFKYKLINGSIRHGIRDKKVSHYFRSVLAWVSPYIVANSFAGLRANNLKTTGNNFVLYNGIDIRFSNIDKAENRTVTLQQYFPDYNNQKDIICISVANLFPYKDYFTVLEALHQLDKEMHFRYIIIGDGPLKAQIQAKINDYSLNNNVLLLGRVNSVNEYLRLADIMIHSSKGEGVSNAILEAMHSGLPVIATNVGGVPETVYPEYSALFEYKDIAQLKKHLLHSKQLIEKFNYNDEGYQQHLKNFSTENMIESFKTILSKITQK